jgi:hypothetical protein
MPKKAKSSKNDIKQKQSQKQIVNVNINQSKTTKKRKPSENKKPPRKQIIYDSSYGQPSLGNPSNNLYYNSPPVIAQLIPPLGGQTNALLPPNNSSIENILKTIKDKTDKLMKPSKKLVDSGTQEIFNMEPKKKIELKQEQLITAPRGNKLQLPARREPPFKLTGEIVQRKNTDMQTEAPKRKKLTDTGSNEVFNIPSETRDYKSILNAANKEMKGLVKKVEKLSKKKETKPMETQTEPMFKSVSSVSTEMPKIQTSSINTQTTAQKAKKLIFNPKKIEKQKQIKKYKDLIPNNLLTTSRKATNFMNIVDNFQPFILSEKDKLLKEELKQKVPPILAAGATMPPAFKPYPKIKPHIPSLIRPKTKGKEVFKPKSLLNVADLNTTKSKDALENFTKMTNIFNTSTKSDKNMNDILQGLQMQNKIPDFIKKDTGGILQTPQKQEKSAIKIQKVIRGNTSRKETEQLKQQVELTQPVELFGGTRSGKLFNPEATAPPQPLFGKDIDKTINENFDKIKAIYSKEPKSYAEVIQANKEMNKYKQQINRIKKRNAKSILSPDQIQLKEDTLKEIKKIKDTYNKIYKEFYKTQQPRKGRKPKA